MLKVGISCINITPPVGIAMDGFAAREPSSIGTHDELKAMALAISGNEATAALVSCDLLDVDASLVKTVRKEASLRTGIPEKKIAVSCTHTHFGPAVSEYNAFFGSREDAAAYRNSLRFHLAGAVQEAFANMREANLGVGWGTSDIGVNRRERRPGGRIVLGQNPEGPVDRQVGVMKFHSSNFKPLGCVVNFACHPVCQTWRMRLVSADYPGRAREVIESLTGARSVFLQGACGNINPVSMENSYEPARKLGTQLGCEVVRVWENIKPVAAGSLGLLSETIGIPRYDYGSKERAEVVAADLEGQLEKLQAERTPEGSINWTKLRYGRALEALESWKASKPMPEIEAEIQAWNIGDAGLVFVPGEVFNEIGTYVKEHSPFSSTFFVGYANGNVGYVPIREAYAEGGYEVDDACQVNPEAADLIAGKCLELLEVLYEKVGKVRLSRES